jgi:DNA invertase Pin-like site-specific DNA recombinase
MKAISYVRWSSLSQSEGDSERRQLELARRVCRENGWELVEDLNFLDAGRSAYSGDDQVELAALLTMLKDGQLDPEIKWLVVESLDRISRKGPRHGLMLLWGIIDAGLNVWADGHRFTKDNADDLGSLVTAGAILSRGSNESKTKTERIREAYAHKRELAAQGERTAHRCPEWLVWSQAKRAYEPIPKAAAAIRLIFELKASGIGKEGIVRRLNADRSIWQPRSGAWHKSYVERILRYRAVIGEYQPYRKIGKKLLVPEGDPIPDYYPAVVDPDLFYTVQAGLDRNRATPGRGGGANGSIANLFGHIARCARCGWCMRYVPGQPPRTYEQLVCDRAKRGLGCNNVGVRYTLLEPLLLHLCRGLDAQDLLTDRVEKAQLSQRRSSIKGELLRLAEEIDSYLESIGRAEGARKRALESKLDQKLVRQTELRQEFETLDSEAQNNTAEAVAQHLQSIEDLIQRMGQLQGAERSDLRRRLRHTLRQLIDRIDLLPGRRSTKIKVAFKANGTLQLVLDGKGGLRLLRDDSGEQPMLYHLDGQGNVVDVAPDFAQGGETMARTNGVGLAAKGVRVNRLVAEALKRRSLNSQMLGNCSGRRGGSSAARSGRA